MQISSKRLIALLAVFALVAFGCGDDDADSNSLPDTPDDASLVEEGDDAAGAVEADPELVQQIASAFLGAMPYSDEAGVCLDDAAVEGPFADVMAAIAAQQQMSDEQVATLATTIRGCVGAEVHDNAMMLGVTFGDDRPGVQTCMGDLFAAEDGEDAYVAVSSLVMGIPVSVDAQAPAIGVLAECVPTDIVADQFGLSYETRSSSGVSVDRECLAEGLDDIDRAAFWEAFIISGDTELLTEADAAAEACADDPNSDLGAEVPGDFEPWAGTGALASVKPDARNFAYVSAPPINLDEGVDYQAVITTEDGEMVFDLFADTAPVAVNNFVSLARDGFYDRTTFHRVLAGFMAQGGDPSGLGSGGPGYSFDDEFEGGPAMDRRGLLAMANSGADSNGSQFFITFAPAEHLTGAHTIFGELVEGDDVLDAVSLRNPDAPTGPGEIVESVRIIETPRE